MNDFRTSALLCLVNALLDEVFPALRLVWMECGEGWIRVSFYVDGEPNDRDMNSMSRVETLMMAQYYPKVEVSSCVIRVDSPTRISEPDPASGVPVYARREP